MLYKLGESIIRILFRLFTRYRVFGRENIPGDGPLLVVANHLHVADPPLIGICLGRKARFMAKEELFRNAFSRAILRSVGAFPVNRRRFGKQALREAEHSLIHGLPLVMFPESTRSSNNRLQPGFPGAAMVAAKSRVAILPVGITGTERIKGVGWWLTRPRIAVNIGIPFRLPLRNGRLTREHLENYTEIIMSHIAALLPKEYRGNFT